MPQQTDPEMGKEYQNTSNQSPRVQIFLQPIAPPAALGLAGFAGSTWVTASWIANWWGSPESPTIFFPFIGIFGGLAQFIAGLYGFKARDTLVTVMYASPLPREQVQTRDADSSEVIRCGDRSGSQSAFCTRSSLRAHFRLIRSIHTFLSWRAGSFR